MKESTIRQYFKSPSMCTNKFKDTFFKEFDIELSVLYKDDKKQVEELVEKVCKGIQSYNNSEDILVLEALYSLCTTYNLTGQNQR